ncbi:acid phosphatase/vanadium-dependent haloperoxidase protein-related protein [Tanacetum coccineum]|uniref:Acid phosphatase/vanadium-dependent haloperoxidase protein-related protein n=1 Tax=Tanacetum coccineum TaxID=301880 RepID=A0ABQ4Y2R2_9ASTR
MRSSIGELVINHQQQTDTSSPPSATSSSRPSLYMNYALMSALTAFALAQSIKVFTTWYKEHRWDLKQLIGSGGMPSSHSATVTALAVAVGLHDGLGGSTFATALILACIVMYDATGVRLHAGRQAEVGLLRHCVTLVDKLVTSFGRKSYLLEDRQIPSVGVFDEVTYMAFGGNTLDLGSFREETDKTMDLHQNLLKNDAYKPWRRRHKHKVTPP